jgi:hypothetical protein
MDAGGNNGGKLCATTRVAQTFCGLKCVRLGTVVLEPEVAQPGQVRPKYENIGPHGSESTSI